MHCTGSAAFTEWSNVGRLVTRCTAVAAPGNLESGTITAAAVSPGTNGHWHETNKHCDALSSYKQQYMTCLSKTVKYSNDPTNQVNILTAKMLRNFCANCKVQTEQCLVDGFSCWNASLSRCCLHDKLRNCIAFMFLILLIIVGAATLLDVFSQ